MNYIETKEEIIPFEKIVGIRKEFRYKKPELKKVSMVSDHVENEYKKNTLEVDYFYCRIYCFDDTQTYLELRDTAAEEFLENYREWRISLEPIYVATRNEYDKTTNVQRLL